MISAKIDKDTRKAVYQRDGWRCAMCDSPKYIQIHHVIPRSRGGNNTMHNLITLCSDCHALAHGQDLRETGITKCEIEQSMLEYMADYYACEGYDPYTAAWWEKSGYIHGGG